MYSVIISYSLCCETCIVLQFKTLTKENAVIKYKIDWLYVSYTFLSIIENICGAVVSTPGTQLRGAGLDHRVELRQRGASSDLCLCYLGVLRY